MLGKSRIHWWCLMLIKKQINYHAFIHSNAAFIEGASSIRTKRTDFASIYNVKISNRFSCETLSLVDGNYRRETSVRLENCNNNGDFASICPQWVHVARSAAVVFTVSKYLASVYNFPRATGSARLSLFLSPFFFIFTANFLERTCESRIIAEKY